jgi:hypothetical protein
MCKRKTEHTGIDGAECKTKKSIVVGILLKLSANLLRQLHCLSSDCGPADSHGICVNVAAGRASVTIGDIPGRAGQLLGGA